MPQRPDKPFVGGVDSFRRVGFAVASGLSGAAMSLMAIGAAKQNPTVTELGIGTVGLAALNFVAALNAKSIMSGARQRESIEVRPPLTYMGDMQRIPELVDVEPVCSSTAVLAPAVKVDTLEL